MHYEKLRKLKPWNRRLKNKTGKQGFESVAGDDDESTQSRLSSHS
jgi:hypothetical protein